MNTMHLREQYRLSFNLSVIILLRRIISNIKSRKLAMIRKIKALHNRFMFWAYDTKEYRQECDNFIHGINALEDNSEY